MKFKSKALSKYFCTALAAVAAVLLVQGAASARSLYVSPSGNGQDGTNWKKAWTSPDKIDWTQVTTGDVIHIDGGATGITYTTSFTVPVSGIAIRQAGGAGHNGPVVFSGAGVNPPYTVGVTLNGSNIHLAGATRAGITFESYASQDIDVHTDNNVINNVQMHNITGLPPFGGGRIGGVTFGGHNNHFINCDFRDTLIGAVEKPVAGSDNVTVFRNCTFGSNWYGWFANNGTGIQGAQPGAAAVSSTIFAEHCVFGPYVDKGIDFASGKLHVTNSLFLAGRLANINMTPPTGASAQATVNQCTFYEKKITGQPLQYGTPEYTFWTNGTGTLKVSNSIVFGGYINVPATQSIKGSGNVQFNVTGNTTALSPTLVDPQLTDEAALAAPSLPTAFIPRTLTILNFAPLANSPATGKGSPIVRVTDICPAYGPTTGLPTAVGGP